MVLILCGLLASAALITLFYPESYQKEQLNYWESTCQYFTGNKRRTRTRQKMLRHVKGARSVNTLDYYRRILTGAGYIRVVSPGRYEVVKKIPKGITTKHARFLTYDWDENWLDQFLEPIPKDCPGWSYATK